MDSATVGPARRRSLALDLTLLGIVGVLLAAALAAGAMVVYQSMYSPAAFVARYLHLLGDGRTADALSLPGVTTDSTALTDAGLPAEASDALLRPAALAPLTDVRTVETPGRDGEVLVSASYRAGPHSGSTTFRVEQAGWVGIVPTWRFAQSPLAVVDLEVRGSMEFAVNGFTIDKRQLGGMDVDPLAPLPMLVFSPGVYSITVDTPVARSDGLAVLSDTPLADIPVALQAQPTEQFRDVVQEEVDAFLAACVTQQVLQPTGCPFGFHVRNRIVELPTWSMVESPAVDIVPDGAHWAIPRTGALAHIDVDIQYLFDGSYASVSEDVPFFFSGTITILPDGTASIQIVPEDG